MNYLKCENVKKEIDKIKKEIEHVEILLKRLPKGELSCCKNEKRYKWFLRENGTSSYLPKGKRAIAEKLALKKYYTYQLDELKKSLMVYEYYIKKMEGVEGKAENLLLHEEWGELLKKFFTATDFTIRHPITGEMVYWEHFGLMDEEEYRNSVYKKLKFYCDNGIIPSINLITTYETKQHPLDANHVEAIIKEYFLS